MRPGRELDTRIAREIFGHEVWATNKTLHERAELGKRPLREYTREMEWAWEVADKMKISLLPIENGQWFAFAGTLEGWKSPKEFIDYLQTGNFLEAGAAVGGSAPLVICIAALKAMEKRNEQAKEDAESTAAGAEETAVMQ